MATKKKADARADEASTASEKTPQRGDLAAGRYEAAVLKFEEAIQSLHAGDWAEALQRFETIRDSGLDEPALIGRADSYARVCRRRVEPAETQPTSVSGLYLQAVMRINAHDSDEAIRLLDLALQEQPGAAELLYARASAQSIKGKVDAAVGDLRQAIAAQPALRFQAANDPDFEPIREEPAFIDVIEPTPTGA